jgi:hypothetical protein
MMASDSVVSISDQRDFRPPLGRSQRKRVAAVRRLAPSLRRCLAAAILIVLPVAAQSPGTPLNPAGQGQSASRFPNQSPPTSANQTLDQKRISLLNKLRQRSMVDDATKLLVLARQLNAEPSNMSDAERMHKAAEIEKLAKSVKEKMSYAVGENPTSPNFSTVFQFQ